MDSGDDLRAAIEANAVFAVVRVISVARDKVGTRSQTTGYTCELVRALDPGSLPSPVVLKHFGPPLLGAETAWLVAPLILVGTTVHGSCASPPTLARTQQISIRRRPHFSAVA
jgi:hypothetical protein